MKAFLLYHQNPNTASHIYSQAKHCGLLALLYMLRSEMALKQVIMNAAIIIHALCLALNAFTIKDAFEKCHAYYSNNNLRTVLYELQV